MAKSDTKRVEFRNFARGLWLNGGGESVPEGAMRRLFGVGRNLNGYVQSQYPMQALNAIAGETGYLVLDAGNLFQGTGMEIYFDLVEKAVANSFDQDGTRLTFLKAPPYVDFAGDYTFVAGGGKLIKFDASGDPTPWGIEAPPDGATGVKRNFGLFVEKWIDIISSSANWPAQAGTPASATSGTIFPPNAGVAASVFQTAAGSEDFFGIQNTVMGMTDLDHDTGTESPEEDFIEVWVRFSDTTNLDAVEIQFSVGNTTFDTFTLTRRIFFSEPSTVNNDPQGVSDVIQSERYGQDGTVQDKATVDRNIVNRTDSEVETASSSQVQKQLGSSTLPLLKDTWLLIQVPKATFTASEKDYAAGVDWDDVRAAKLTTFWSDTGAPAGASVYWSGLQLVGGVGMLGNYKYQYTYLDSTTGHRSNPNPTPIEVKGVQRQSVQLNLLQPSANPSVDTIEIWRTVGGGEVMFKAAEVANNAISYDDSVADYPGMYSGNHITVFPDFLQETELLFNNDPPEDTFEWVADRLFAGRAWWVGDTANPNRVYYSAVGRPQAVDGFVFAGSFDDPTKGAVVWNDVLYVFTRQRIYRVVGDDEPFTVDEVFGAPGTKQPHTLAVSPHGIFYFGIDGVRLFDGATSRLVGYEAVEPLYQQQTVESLGPFEGVVGCWGEEEYFVSDETYILVYRPSSNSWRQLPLAAESLYASPNDHKVILAVGGVTRKLADTSGTVGMLVQVETPTIRTAVDANAIFKHIQLDLDSQGQDVLVQLIMFDNVATFVATVNTTGRTQVELPIGIPTKEASVRLLIAAPTDIVTIWGIDLDVYVPEC